MRFRLVLVTVLLLAVVGSGATYSVAALSSGSTVSDASPATTPSPTPSSGNEPAPTFMPAPNKPLARKPGKLAGKLKKVTAALDESVREWTVNGHPSWNRRPPKAVVLQSLYRQRIYRLMSRKRGLGRHVIRRLDGRVAREARANMTAGVKLRSLVTPVKRVKFKTQRPEPAGDLLAYYKKAQRRFHVDWQVLAAVNMVETKFGRIKSRSSAGALGPMQFLRSTWRAYGMGGNVHDPHDAILGAANYLHASGAPQNYRSALYNYNHANAYVKAVLLYARQMKRRPNDYFSYYNWQVFVITTRGDVRITGPRPR